MIEKEFPKRKPTRLKDFDYNQAGAYFVTVCTEHRENILSVVGGDAPQIELLPYGMIVDRCVNQLRNFYEDITVDRYVIMPNHIHVILILSDDGASRTSPPTRQHSRVSSFVSTFKRFCNKEYGRNIWQTSFHDHIIRDREDYEKHVRYILENPMQWRYDELYCENDG
ncbi:MAG: transposase [Clostridia bacterium]|nr:transposase [Clostridia bacterium]